MELAVTVGCHKDLTKRADIKIGFGRKNQREEGKRSNLLIKLAGSEDIISRNSLCSMIFNTSTIKIDPH